MSYEPENRSFAIGREIGGVGRWTRLALGLLGLIYVAMNVLQVRLSAALIGQLAGGALLSAVLYIVVFWAMGERVLAHLRPWIRTGIFWFPLALIPFLFLIPWGWGSGVLLYMSVALITGALTSYGGCEVVALPSFLFHRRYVVYCPLNAIDVVERRYAKR
jgi:Family of unknown function (DUF6410)